MKTWRLVTEAFIKVALVLRVGEENLFAPFFL